LAGFNAAGTIGQFGVGLLLGTVWSPCVGPTLGAASLLAAQGKDLGHVVATMAAFAIGVGVPLVLIGLASRSALQNMRGRMMAAGSSFKIALGVILILLGGLVLTGFDKAVETAVVDASPTWLTTLTTRF
jgi:cytochrome c biogenesis protein CcdA